MLENSSTNNIRAQNLIEAPLYDGINIDEKDNSLCMRDESNGRPDHFIEEFDFTNHAFRENVLNPSEDSCSLDRGNREVKDRSICELQRDEIEIDGLGESGLSSEFNSLSASINDIIEENKLLHSIINVISNNMDCRIKGELQIESKLTEKFGLEIPALINSLDKREKNHHTGEGIPQSSIAETSTGTSNIQNLSEDNSVLRENCSKLEAIVITLWKLNRRIHSKFRQERLLLENENCKLSQHIIMLMEDSSNKNEDSSLNSNCNANTSPLLSTLDSQDGKLKRNVTVKGVNKKTSSLNLSHFSCGKSKRALSVSKTNQCSNLSNSIGDDISSISAYRKNCKKFSSLPVLCQEYTSREIVEEGRDVKRVSSEILRKIEDQSLKGKVTTAENSSYMSSENIKKAKIPTQYTCDQSSKFSLSGIKSLFSGSKLSSSSSSISKSETFSNIPSKSKKDLNKEVIALKSRMDILEGKVIQGDRNSGKTQIEGSEKLLLSEMMEVTRELFNVFKEQKSVIISLREERKAFLEREKVR